jgi:hypothetical protein
MLQETDDRLEKLQTEVGEVTTGSTTAPSLPPGSYCPPTEPISSPENSSDQGTIHILRKHFFLSTPTFSRIFLSNSFLLYVLKISNYSMKI